MRDILELISSLNALDPSYLRAKMSHRIAFLVGRSESTVSLCMFPLISS
jgi:hypothetical protein